MSVRERGRGLLKEGESDGGLVVCQRWKQMLTRLACGCEHESFGVVVEEKGEGGVRAFCV